MSYCWGSFVLMFCWVDEPGPLVRSAVDGQLGGMQHGLLGPTACILVRSL